MQREPTQYPAPAHTTPDVGTVRSSARWKHILLCTLVCMLSSGGLHAAGPVGPSPDETLGILAPGELRAVQKPIIRLNGALELGLTGLALPLDLYVTGAGAGGWATWHFSDVLGVEAFVAGCGGWETWPNQLLQNQGVRFDSYVPRFLAQTSLLATPIYAKLSLLGRRVVHFDVGFLMGAGIFFAERTIYGDSVAAEDAERYGFPLSLSGGLVERFYLHAFGQTLILRLGLRDQLTLAESEAGQWVKHNTTLELGLGVLLEQSSPKKASGQNIRSTPAPAAPSHAGGTR